MPGHLGIDLYALDVDEDRIFTGSGSSEVIFDARNGTSIRHTIDGAEQERVDYGAPVRRINAMAGDDTIQIDVDISGLVIFGDSAGNGVGIDGHDWIEIDRRNVAAEQAAPDLDDGSYVYGEGGDDFLGGSQRTDWLFGDSGHDFVSGHRGDDQIVGGRGHDWIQGDEGDDALFGDAGNDRLFGGAGGDMLNGGDGNDHLWGDTGGAVFRRNASGTFWDGANETINPLGSDDEIVRDVAPSEAGSDILRGGDGNDVLYGGGRDDFLYGENGNDSLQGESGDDELFGGNGNDILWGDIDPLSYETQTSGDATGHMFRAHGDARNVAGHDHLSGGRGNDRLYGGDGDDTYEFNYGDAIDIIDDRAGTDTIVFESAINIDDLRFRARGGDLVIKIYRDGTASGDQLIVVDWFDGKPVESFVFGGGNSFTINDIEVLTARSAQQSSSEQSETANLKLLTNNVDVSIVASNQGDTIYGLGGNDILAGGDGDDRLYGGAGDDHLSGNADNDRLFGEAGKDFLFGQLGNDELRGGEGADNLHGGLGDDVYHFARGDGDDLIRDDGGLADKVVFANEIIQRDVTVDFVGDTIVLDVRRHDRIVGDRITIVDGLGEQTSVEAIEFGNGSSWNIDELMARRSETIDLASNTDSHGGPNASTYKITDVLDDGFVLEVADSGGIDQLDLGPTVIGDTILSSTLNDATRVGNALVLDITVEQSSPLVTSARGEIRIADFYNEKGFVEAIIVGDEIANENNEAPVVAGLISDQLTLLNRNFSFSLAASTFEDSVFDRLTFSATRTDGATLPAWLSFEPVTQTFTGIAETIDAEIIDIAVHATDSRGLSNTATFELNIGNINVAPVIAKPLADRFTRESEQFTYSLPTDAFTDSNLGDTLEHSAQTLHGEELPGWLHFDPQAQRFTGTPSATDVGQSLIKVRATDNGGLSVANAFAINVDYVNDAPTVELAIPDQTLTEQASFVFSVAANSFNDVDAVHGDELAYRLSRVDGRALPGWLNFDSNRLEFSGRPVGIQRDVSIELRLTATDNHGASAASEFSVDVSNFGGARDWIVPHDPLTVHESTYSQTQNLNAALSDGGYVVVWESAGRDGDRGGIYAQRYRDNGTQAGAAFRVNTTISDEQRSPAVVGIRNGGFVVSWVSLHEDDGAQSYGQDFDGGGIYAQQFSASGEKHGVEFRVNPVYSGVQEQTVVAALSDGGYFISWLSQFSEQRTNSGEYGVGEAAYFGRRYSASGSALGSAIKLVSSGLTPYLEPTIAGLTDGGFVLAWRDRDADGAGIRAQGYAPSGSKTGAELSVNANARGEQTNPKVVGLSGGGFVIAWQSDDGEGADGIFAQIFTHSGVRIGNEIRVNESNADKLTAPALSATPDGGFIINWVAGTLTGVGDVFAQRFNDRGDRVGHELRVDTDAAYNASTAVSALVDGTIVHSWSTGDGGASSTDDGRTWDLDSPVRIDARLYESRANIELGVLETNVAVVGSEFKGIIYRLAENIFFDPDIPYGDEINFSAHSVNDGELPAWLSFDADTATFTGLPLSADIGTFDVRVVARELSGAVAESIVTFDIGAAADITVSANPATYTVSSSEPLENNDPTVAVLRDDSRVVVWDSGSTIRAQKMGAGGGFINDEFRIDSGTRDDSGAQIAALRDGGFVVTWERDDQSIFARRYDARAEASGSEFKIADIVANGELFASVAALDDGGFVVTWLDETDDASARILAQRFSADDTSRALGAAIEVTTSVNQLSYPVISSLTGGGFLTVWTQLSESGSTQLYSRRFDHNGVALTDQIRIDGGHGDGAEDPFVTALTDGAYLVTWTGQIADGDDDIFARLFEADGSARGNAWRVNNLTNWPQRYASATATSDGGFVIAWHSERWLNSAEYGFIQAQHFDRLGNPTGDGLHVALESTEQTSGPVVAARKDGGFDIFWQSDHEQEGATDSILGRRFAVSGSEFNLPPTVASAIEDRIWDEGIAAGFTVPLASIVDPEGEVLSFRANLVGGNELPHWLKFDAVARHFSGTPDNDDVGAYDIAITATDVESDAVAETFVLRVANVNDAPIAKNDLAGLRLQPSNKTLLLDVLANDTDIDRGDTTATFTIDAAKLRGNHGEVSIVGNQLQFNARSDFDGLGTNEIREVVIDYTMSDKFSAKSSAVATVVVSNSDITLAPGATTVISTPGHYYGNGRFSLGTGSSGTRITFGRQRILDAGAGSSNAGFGTSARPNYVELSSESGIVTVARSTGAGIPGIGVVEFTGLQKQLASFSLGSLRITFENSDLELHIEDFDPTDVYAGSPTIDTFIFDGTTYNYAEFLGQGFDIVGSVGSDTLAGTNIHDRIDALTGNDSISSGEGDDVISGGPGADIIDGGRGDDTYRFARGDGHDTIIDNQGNDKIVFSADISSADVVSSRLGSDLQVRFGADDSLTVKNWYVDPKNQIESFVFTANNLRTVDATLIETIHEHHAPRLRYPIADQSARAGVQYSFTLPQETFYDVDIDQTLTYFATTANGTLLPAWLTFNPGTLSFHGKAPHGAQSFEIKLTATDATQLSASDIFKLDIPRSFNEIKGSSSDDILRGTWQADRIRGGWGDDRIYGRSGNDILFGNSGRDWLSGGAGADKIFGGGGADTIDGGNGRNTINAGAGEDLIKTGRDNDWIAGASGADRIDAGSGDDVIYGGDHDDEIYAGAGSDRIDAGRGDDYIVGGSGDDLIKPGAGDDIIEDGGGDDSYVFDRNGGIDRILDSDGSNDLLTFGANIDALDLWFSRDAADLRVDLAGTLDNLTIEDWYSDSSRQIETFVLGDGRRLLNSDVDQLVHAMAAFGAQSHATMSVPAALMNEVRPVIAAAWQTA